MKAGEKLGEACNGPLEKEEFDEIMIPYYELMAEDIIRQKKRLGGTFAVAHCVLTKNGRSMLRKHLGSDLVFINLNMTKECQAERIKQRHGDNVGEAWESFFNLYEPGEDDEENTFKVTIEDGMTKDDVLQKVLNIVKDFK